jgi:hypothetical protein
MKHRSSKEIGERQAVWRQGGECHQSSRALVPDLSKLTKAERIKEMVLILVWLSDSKALLDTNSYF